MARISEDIRFYLPSDPYYYKVDNLPLQDLLKNDRRLQTQIDELQQADVGVTVNRNGILELKPFINNAIPGTISVNAGSFIGRVQRSSQGNGVIGSTLDSVYNGTEEIGTPPTIQDPEGGSGDWKYNTGNPPNNQPAGGELRSAGHSVGRTAVFNFPGGNISIDGWNEGDFQSVTSPDITNAPQGRIDVVGITTVNGALDDPFIPGNAEELNIAIGNGQCKLAVVKGAGLIGPPVGNSQTREVGITIGERYQTIGQPGAQMNVNAKNPDGTLTSDPKVGTYPMPDDVVNICFSRADIRDNLTDWAQRNRNASFFLPIAYVYVNTSHQANNPIPQNWLYDIRPFFRTAELTLNERQALAASVNPSVTNPVVTASYQETRFGEEVDRTNGLASVQQQLNVLRTQLEAAFNNLTGDTVQTQAQTLVSDNPGSTYTIASPSNYGVPVNASHVILSTFMQMDAGAGRSDAAYTYFDGGDGEVIGNFVVAGDSGGIEGGGFSQVILKLDEPSQAGIGGTFRYRQSGGDDASVNRVRIYISGYITPTEVSVSFPAPSDTTQ